MVHGITKVDIATIVWLAMSISALLLVTIFYTRASMWSQLPLRSTPDRCPTISEGASRIYGKGPWGCSMSLSLSPSFSRITIDSETSKNVKITLPHTSHSSLPWHIIEYDAGGCCRHTHSLLSLCASRARCNWTVSAGWVASRLYAGSSNLAGRWLGGRL